MALRNQGKLDEAIAEYREAMRLKPDYPEAHNNLGVTLKDQGKLDEAIAEYREALRLKPDTPRPTTTSACPGVQGKLGRGDRRIPEAMRLKPDIRGPQQPRRPPGRPGEAGRGDRRVLATALRLKPDFRRGPHQPRQRPGSQGKLDEAIAEYREALRLKPDYSEAHNDLGNALLTRGKAGRGDRRVPRGATAQARARRSPQQPRRRPSNQGKLDEAIAEYREALPASSPTTPKPTSNLGALSRRPGEAGRGDRRAPRSAAAQARLPRRPHNLGSSCKNQGKLDEAIVEFREASGSSPISPRAHYDLGNA